MNDDPSWNRRLMGGLAVATAAALLVFTGIAVAGTGSLGDLGLSVYILAVPIVFTVLAFALPAFDIEDGMPPKMVEYHRRSGFIFGGVMFAITAVAIAVMILV